MNASFEYLFILLILFLTAFLLEKRFHMHLYPNRKKRFVFISFLFFIGVLWDTFAVLRGHWIFPQGKNLGIKIGVLPLEEYLFMFIIPYFTITFYKLIITRLKA